MKKGIPGRKNILRNTLTGFTRHYEDFIKNNAELRALGVPKKYPENFKPLQVEEVNFIRQHKRGQVITTELSITIYNNKNNKRYTAKGTCPTVVIENERDDYCNFYQVLPIDEYSKDILLFSSLFTAHLIFNIFYELEMSIEDWTEHAH